MKEYSIASIAGDGIGKEVVPEAQKILKEISQQHQFKLKIEDYDFASCDYYEKHGKMMPDDWKDKLTKHDAIFFGAVGMPDKYPDHITLWGSLLKFRREFDQFINLRPVKLFEGVNAPLANKKHYGGLSDYRSSEGRTVRVKYRGKINDTILNILGGVRSSCTYVGAPSLKQLSKCTAFVRVTKQFNDTFTK